MIRLREGLTTRLCKISTNSGCKGRCVHRNVISNLREFKMRSQKDKAEDFRGLHHGKRILILPNAWDVPMRASLRMKGSQRLQPLARDLWYLSATLMAR